jgi:chromosomal replication initiator protein DnaA
MGDAVRANEEKREYEGLSALARATAARAGEDRDAEAEALREALLHIPDSEDVLSRMVECEAARGRETDAQEASRLLAVVQRTAGRDADAAGTLAAALERAPRDIETLRDYCDVLREAGKPEEALARGLTLVDLLADESRFDEAAATFDSLVRLDDANLDLREKEIDFLLKLGRLSASHEKLFELASRYSDAGDADAGELTLLRVLDADAGNIRALSALVSLHEAGGRREQLENRLQELAEAQFAAGLFEDAVSTSRRLLATNPENVDARRQLVRFHAERGLVEEAIDELFGLADQLRANEAGADAVDAEREAVLLAPAHQGARRRLAESLLREGDEAGGIAELEELARVQSDGGEFELALETLASVLERSPDRTAARVQRAEVYAKKGDQEKALEEYRAVSTSLSQGAAAKADAPSAPPVQPTLQLVREYDFDRFVIGGNNNFAYATALAVARAPAQAYNPLFIYSDVGLGKTHLVNAIANHMLKQNPGARIIYTNSEDFTAEVVEAIQTNTIIQFRTKYKTVDLLIVDDVQFLAGKERAQEEFFHIFNALFQAKRQIVITSDRPPKDIARLENRLLSRFGAGVIVDIAAPDVETRTAILHREIANSQLEIEPGIAVLIAERVCSNVRELKGALNQIVAMRTLRGMEPNEENVRQVLDSLYVRA